MKANLKITPAYFPITLDEAKKQCEIDDGDTRHDDFIKSILRAETGRAEQYLHRRLISQTWNCWKDCWPWSNSIDIPFGSLQSVVSVKYKDETGDETTLDPGDYIVDTDTEPGRIVLAYQKSWPTDTLYPSNPIKIEFECGYFMGSTWIKNTTYAEDANVIPITENGLVYQSAGGTSAATEPTWPLEIGETVSDGTVTWTCLGIAVPDAIRHAIKIGISDMFENREENVFMPNHFNLQTWENLLFPYKLWGGIIESR